MSGTARAEKALFVLHYKRVLLPVAIVYFGLLAFTAAGVYVVGHFQGWSEKDIRGIAQGLDIMAVVLGVGFALPVGTAVFSRVFKEQQILFFHTLPVSRARQWMILMASSAAALLTTYGIAAVFRPGVVKMLYGERDTGLAVIAAAILAFAAGACFALVFTRAIAVYTTAFIVPYLFLVAAAALVAQPYYLLIGPRTRSGGSLVDQFVSRLPISIMVTVIVFFIVAYFACSLLFYVRGELVTLRTQLQNFGIVLGIGCVIALGVTLIALTITSHRAPLDRWSLSVAPSGRFGLQLMQAEVYPWRTKVQFIDLDNGKRALIDTPGMIGARPGPDVCAIVSRDMSIFTRNRSDRVVLYDPDGKPVRAARFAGQEIIGSAAREDGRFVVLTSDGAKAHIYDLSRNSDPRELATASVDQTPNCWVAGNSVLIMNRIEQSRGWSIADGVATELPWAKATTKVPMPTIFRGVVFPDRESVLRHVEHDLPLPRDPGEAVAYDIPSFWRSRRGIETLFAIRANVGKGLASLYVLPAKETTWHLISRSVPLLKDDNFAAEPAFMDRLSSLAASDGYDRLSYLDASTTKPTVRLFDSRTNRTIDVMVLPDIDPRLFIILFARPRNLSLLSVSVHTDDVNRNIEKGQWLYDGTLTPLRREISGRFLTRRDDGTLVFETMRGVGFLAPNGVKREIQMAEK